MPDADDARTVLQWFYDNRERISWRTGERLTPEDFGGQFSAPQLLRLVQRLSEHGLVRAKYGGEGEESRVWPHAITADGIDVIEGTPKIMSPMTYNELRTRILEYLRDSRGRDRLQGITVEDVGAISADAGLMHRVLLDLYDDGFVRGVPVRNSHGATIADADITKEGMALLSPPPATIHNDHRQFSIGSVSGGTVQQGDGNSADVSLHLQAIIEAIQASEMTDEEKRGALARLRDFTTSPGLGNALQGLGVAAQLFGDGV